MGEMNRDAIIESLGELRLAWDAMFRRLAELEARVRRLENPKHMIGTIDGLEGEWTITPSPRFES